MLIFGPTLPHLPNIGQNKNFPRKKNSLTFQCLLNPNFKDKKAEIILDKQPLQTDLQTGKWADKESSIHRTLLQNIPRNYLQVFLQKHKFSNTRVNVNSKIISTKNIQSYLELELFQSISNKPTYSADKLMQT